MVRPATQASAVVTDRPELRGIAGLKPREPVGAVLRVGRKGPSGAPIEKDRYTICSPFEAPCAYKTKTGKTFNGTVRAPLDAFAAFNDATPEKRRSLRGNLVHATEHDVWHYKRAAVDLQDARFPMHPNKIPTCEGDGRLARRLYGINDEGVEDWREIPCPNDLCPYAKLCPPMLRFYFRPRWPEGNPLPSPLIKFTSRAWSTCANFLGFFEMISSVVEGFQMGQATLFGVPFVLTLHSKVDRKKGHVYAVTTITPDGDLVEFFGAQAAQLRDAGFAAPAMIAGATDPSEIDPKTVAADIADLTPAVPAVTVPMEISTPPTPVEKSDPPEGDTPSLF